MEKVTIVKVKDIEDNEIEHVIIDHGNEEFTSMLKSIYDAQQAEQKPVKAPKVVNETTPE